MAAIKLHGYCPNSSATLRVLACLYEKQLDFEFVLVNLKAAEHKQELFISFNPFGLVPALEHGDLTLFESRAITQYISHSFADKGTQLLCSGKQRAVFATWKEVEAHQFEPAASKLVWELYLKPKIFGMETDAAVVEENEAKLAKVLDVYESRLVKSKYLVSDSFTLVDLHHIPRLQYLLGTPMKKLFDSRSHVNSWAADVLARPAWSKVIAFQTQY